MITFESQELKETVKEIVEYFDIISVEYDFINFDEIDDPEIEEIKIIDLNTPISLGLPEGSEYVDFRLGEVIDLYSEVKSSKLFNSSRYISPKRILIKVDLLNRERLSFIDDTIFNITVNYMQQDFRLDLIFEDFAFGLAITATGEYDDYFPPLFSEDMFIEISSEQNINVNIIEDLVQAYIFEINASINIDLHESPRPELINSFENNEEEISNSFKLRPLILGDGTSELLKLYNSASHLDTAEIRILYYSKVIEFVSQSVVKKELIETVLNKLYTKRSLKPDAEYVLEFEKIFDEQRSYRKDSEAIRLTIETCCDIDEIRSISPNFLKKVKCLTLQSSKDERIEALKELATAVSDTRNMIAHAKTDYIKKGKECPEKQLDDFAECCRIVALQVIRWYSRQHESAIIK